MKKKTVSNRQKKGEYLELEGKRRYIHNMQKENLLLVWYFLNRLQRYQKPNLLTFHKISNFQPLVQRKADDNKLIVKV